MVTVEVAEDALGKRVSASGVDHVRTYSVKEYVRSIWHLLEVTWTRTPIQLSNTSMIQPVPIWK